MNQIESAIYNRISTKCHLFVKEYYPTEYKRLCCAAEEEYRNRQYRRTSFAQLQQALKNVPNHPQTSVDDPNDDPWGDRAFSISLEEKAHE
jgi:hypothetical protein